ncbi:hypothetical protein [Hydrogenophaga sp.]|uniref:hypothetical protein n=1 Tax=Hydrogenophaga sp. TaxID=1904254 RepID=UPI0035688563
MAWMHGAQRWIWGVLIGVCLAGPVARADELTDHFDTFWQLQWQQSGYLRGLTRWPLTPEKQLHYSFSASSDNTNRRWAVDALKTVLDVMGWTGVEVPAGDARAQLLFEVREFTDEEARQYACWAKPHMEAAGLEKVDLVLSSRWAYTCVLHEMMHAMGLPGHPSGDTVLSYFKGNQLQLTALDRFFLKALYAPQLTLSMSPLEVAQHFNHMWIEQEVPMAGRAAAWELEKRWFDGTVSELEAFASGSGEPPKILYRSGKINDEGVRWGRMQVQYLLGWSYLGEAEFAPNLGKAQSFLLQASRSGHEGAARTLLHESTSGRLKLKVSSAVCEWARGVPAEQQAGAAEHYKTMLSSPACSLAPLGLNDSRG